MSAPPAHSVPHTRRRWLVGIVVVVVIAAVVGWRLAGKGSQARGARKAGGPVAVVTAIAESRDVPVRLASNGTVTAIQSVDLRAQITSTVKQVHIREGQAVKGGELLFTLDAGTEEANLAKARAQVEKDQADLATARRNLDRQQELFRTHFISQAALDTAQNSVDTLTGQLAIDRAAVEAARVALTYTEIRAPFAGRTGLINVRAGSLVQPTGAASSTAVPAMVTVTQVDPIDVAFTLPERELPALQQAYASGALRASASAPGTDETFTGKVIFVDNAVDTATGTIRLKAEFDNPKAKLWPGMFVNVQVSPRTIRNATVVPAQAVQTGPDERFIYVVGADHKVAETPVKLAYVEQGFAVVDGLKAGSRVVVEGAQNVRPGSVVAESDRTGPGNEEAAKGEPRKPEKGKAGKPA
ncbi:MAG TPA: efflux RND transporter periplasmic adaptor subunit [Usitatibacter sp.]|nr:efflux RND transporter periplasmic adaptor subunit [Usitatibacter sp.]